MDISKRILEIVGDKGILVGPDVAARKAGIWIEEGIKAKAIVRPKNTEELSKVLAICNEEKQSVVAQGGLTGLVEGAITSHKQIAISTETLQIGELNEWPLSNPQDDIKKICNIK